MILAGLGANMRVSTVNDSSKQSVAEAQNESPRARLMPLLFVIAAAAAVFFTNLGRYPLFNPDEALYAEPAREMLESGQYLTTYFNYAVYFTKPPLTIWLMVLNYCLFGVTEFAARFGSAASALILIATTYLFVEKYVNKRAAMIAAFSLITAPLFIGTGRESITDMPLSLFMAGSLLSFYHGFRQQEGRWRWLAYCLIGLAVLTKGPVGLLLPVVILCAFHTLRADWKEAFRYYKPFQGLLIVLTIALPWFAVEIYTTKGGYFNEFIVRENFQRFTGVVDHKEPWWYHIAAMTGGFFPWTIFLPSAIVSAFTHRDKSVPLLPSNVISRCRRLPEEQAVLLYCALWSLIFLTFFSVSVSKLLPYTVPAFPAIALITGYYVDRLAASPQARGLKFAFGGLTLTFAIAAFAVPLVFSRLRDCPSDLITILPCLFAAQALIAFVALVAAMLKNANFSVKFFMAMSSCAIVGFGMPLLDMLSTQWEEPIVAYSHYAAQSNWPIVVFGLRAPSVPFYARRQVFMPKTCDELAEDLRRIDHAYIITRSSNARDLTTVQGCRALHTTGRFTLAVFRKPSTSQ
jgi:4-amino-4-deoxy-L-arabinose transferase-like glycosyltransferase